MIKVFPATASGGKVTIEGVSPDDVSFAVQGQGSSSGFLIIAEDESVYISNTQPDLQAVIDQLKQVCEQLKTIGNYAYVVGADAMVTGTPLIAVATAATQIEQTLDSMELI